MDRNEILNTVAGVLKDRGTTHGPMAKVYTDAGESIALYMKHRYGVTIGVLADDVMEFLNCIKRARRNANPSEPDNYVDQVGYIALMAELSTGPVHNAKIPVAPAKMVLEPVEIEAALEQFVKDSLAPLPVDKSVKTKV